MITGYPFCIVDGGGLYWSNADGWGGHRGADWFSVEEVRELNLPVGGEWAAECEGILDGVVIPSVKEVNG